MVHMQKKNVSDVNTKSSKVKKDERIVIHLEKLLAALDYHETNTTVQSVIPKAT